MFFTDKYKKCEHCGDWINIHEKHVTGTVDGKTVYLHHDWCADVYVGNITNVQFIEAKK
jgi:hypothetical protein